MLAVLYVVGSLPWEEVLPSQSSRGSGEQTFRILSANISAWGAQADGVLQSSEVERFQTVALAEHLLGVNSIITLGKLWKQTGFNSETVRKFDQRYIRRNKHRHAEPSGAGRLEYGEVGRARALSLVLTGVRSCWD